MRLVFGWETMHSLSRESAEETYRRPFEYDATHLLRPEWYLTLAAFWHDVEDSLRCEAVLYEIATAKLASAMAEFRATLPRHIGVLTLVELVHDDAN